MSAWVCVCMRLCTCECVSTCTHVSVSTCAHVCDLRVNTHNELNLIKIKNFRSSTDSYQNGKPQAGRNFCKIYI